MQLLRLVRGARLAFQSGVLPASFTVETAGAGRAMQTLLAHLQAMQAAVASHSDVGERLLLAPVSVFCLAPQPCCHGAQCLLLQARCWRPPGWCGRLVPCRGHGTMLAGRTHPTRVRADFVTFEL